MGFDCAVGSAVQKADGLSIRLQVGELLWRSIGFQFTFRSTADLIPINVTGNEHHHSQYDKGDD